MPTSDLPSWLARIQAQHPHSIELELSRIATVATKMGIGSFHCPVIVVGGTNGKGSCVTLLAAIYRQLGYHVGHYTSPHLFQFNERICIDEQPVSDQQLMAAFDWIEQQRHPTTLTFFEFTTLAALWIFQQATLDVVILEVGLGGRLDAVNLVDADVSIITNVALDHCAWLGTDRNAIAYEKAGIMRAQQPVLFGEVNVPSAITQQAQQIGASLLVLGNHMQTRVQSTHWELDWQGNTYVLPAASLNPESVFLAATAVLILAQRLPFTWSIVQQAVANTRLPGRQQHCGAYLFDVAHNPAAAQRLSEWVAANKSSGRLYAVFGCCADKDVGGILNPLVRWVDHWFIAPFADERSASMEQLQRGIADLTVQYTLGQNLEEVTRQAQMQLTLNDQLLIFGSFHTVEEVYPLVV
ncbi:MAG: bifunctional folylpolyglutamate synthase/dihydrofolate synthase [Legionellales bacterium]|nr:bifunctional folylpolyglutamate synthase/dihydrofolate synthase [Legionellales bacterium]